MKYTTLFLLSLTCLAGCAYDQSVALLNDSSELKSYENVSIIDNRSDKSKKTSIGPGDECSRWYGDSFIEPSKITYLKYAIGSKITGSDKLSIEIENYTTVEYCLDTAKKVAAEASAAAVAAVTGTTVYYTVPTKGPGDFFRLILSGTVNGKAFNFRGDFVYSDLDYINFPSENEEYRNRIKELLDQAVEYILSIANELPKDN